MQGMQLVQAESNPSLQTVWGLYIEDGPPLQLACELYGVQELQIFLGRPNARSFPEHFLYHNLL